MELIINNKVINGDLKIILNKLKYDCGKSWLFKEFNESSNNLISNCPYHKDDKPSWSIYNVHDNSDIEFGLSHCFSCMKTSSLPQLVADCFEEDLEFGENWLLDNFGGDRYEENLLPEIDLDGKKSTEDFLNIKILDQFNYYHDYMWQRKLTKEIVDRFRIGYDNIRNAITFPVWDIKNRLKFITARAVNTKRFWIPKGADKENNLYLLNFAIQDKAPVILVCEGQFDALSSWGYSIPAIATFGGITLEQIKLLNKSGARTIISGFDNDVWGEKFYNTLRKNLRDDILLEKLEIPKGKKDINDMTKEEFDASLDKIGIKWRLNKN